MLAVVQIGSKILRSPCRTARTVRALVGADWAWSRPGADKAAAVAMLRLTNVRRDVAIGLLLAPHFLLLRLCDRFRHGRSGAASLKRGNASAACARTTLCRTSAPGRRGRRAKGYAGAGRG